MEIIASEPHKNVFFGTIPQPRKKRERGTERDENREGRPPVPLSLPLKSSSLEDEEEETSRHFLSNRESGISHDDDDDYVSPTRRVDKSARKHAFGGRQNEDEDARYQRRHHQSDKTRRKTRDDDVFVQLCTQHRRRLRGVRDASKTTPSSPPTPNNAGNRCEHDERTMEEGDREKRIRGERVQVSRDTQNNRKNKRRRRRRKKCNR